METSPSIQKAKQMTSSVGFPPVTIYDITDITQGVPAVVTVSSVAEDDAFFLINGMTVTFSNVVGMFQINRERGLIGNLDSNARTFSLYTVSGRPFDTGAFNSYISGGQINIISYPAQAGEPPGLMYNTQPINV